MINRAFDARRAGRGPADAGFTLIELLVVIIIIGILAAIAIPILLSQRRQAADADMQSDLNQVVANVESARATLAGTLPAVSGATDPTVTAAGGGVLPGGNLAGNYNDANTFTARRNAAATDYCIVVDRVAGSQPGSQAWVFSNGAVQPAGVTTCDAAVFTVAMA